MTSHRAWIGLSLALLAVGCGTPPKEYFYTLGDYTLGDLATGDAAATGSNYYTVAIAPVSVPEGVDRPQMVVRAGINRVELSELHRWAEPLKSEIPRVLAVHLRRALRTARIATADQSASLDADYRIAVDVQRFESTLVSGSRLRHSGACAPRGVAEPAPAGPSSPSRRETPTTKPWPPPMAGRSRGWQASWRGRYARCGRRGRYPEPAAPGR
jgi:uncharacterized lipoprotein YmbA